MVTRHLGGFIYVLFLCVIFSSCTIQESNTHYNTELSLVESPTVSTFSEYNDAPIYNAEVKNIKDSDFIVTEVKIPSQTDPYNVDGSIYYKEVRISHILDDSHVLLMRSRGDDSPVFPPINDIVVYNFISGEWDEPMNIGEEYENIYVYPVYIDEKYCIATTTVESMVYRAGTLVLFDRVNNNSKTIFEYHVGDDTIPYTGYHPNNIIIWDNQVYFDDYVIGQETDPTLYAYDIESSELHIVRDCAMNPLVYKNEIWFFVPDENGAYSLLQSKSGNGVLKNPHQIGEVLSSGDELFTTRGMGEDSTLGTSLTGVFEWNSDTAIAESRRGNVLFGLQANNDFIAWHTTMQHQPPCIYDVMNDVLYEFVGDYAYNHCDFMFYLNGQTGLLYMAELREDGLRTGNEKYFLFQKQ